MIEVSGSVPLTNGSGSRRPKNIRIQRIRIRTRIGNTAAASLSDPDPNWFGIQIGSVADPGSGAILTPGSGIRNPGWVKIQDPDPGWTSRISLYFGAFFNPNGKKFRNVFLICNTVEQEKKRTPFFSCHCNWHRMTPPFTSAIAKKACS